MLTVDRWKAAINLPEVQHEDSIRVDLREVSVLLKDFEQVVKTKSRLTLHGVSLNLSQTTTFELYVAMQHLRMMRTEIESTYATAAYSRRRAWVDALLEKMRNRHE